MGTAVLLSEPWVNRGADQSCTPQFLYSMLSLTPLKNCINFSEKICHVQGYHKSKRVSSKISVRISRTWGLSFAKFVCTTSLIHLGSAGSERHMFWRDRLTDTKNLHLLEGFRNFRNYCFCMLFRLLLTLTRPIR